MVTTEIRRSPLKLFLKDEIWPENFIISLILKDESWTSINVTIDYGNLQKLG